MTTLQHFTLRPGSIDDAAEIARIYNYYVANSDAIFSDHIFTREEMRQKIELLQLGTVYPFIVADCGQGLLGYCYAHQYKPDPVYGLTWELTIYLDHNHLGGGLGTKMYQQLIDKCHQMGAKTLIANVTAGNTPSERLHERMGFRLVGHLRDVGYKFSAWHSDIIYQL